MDGEFPDLCREVYFWWAAVNASGFPITLRLNTAIFSPGKDARSITIRVADVGRLNELDFSLQRYKLD